MDHFIQAMPKAELHVHLIGTLDPAHMLQLAQRNNISLPLKTVPQAEHAYQSYTNLKSFLEVYDCAAQVMCTEQDFYDVLYAYLQRASQQGVVYVEIFFEAQAYIPKGITFRTIITGLDKARTDAQQAFNIRCELILCFQREFGQQDALIVLEESVAYKDKIIGIGLAGNEREYPPSLFITLYKQAKKYGYKCDIHAGEDTGPAYIWQAINLLHADRIAHGVQCMQDPTLITYLAEHKIALTVCPLSNIRLGIYEKPEEHPLKQMLEQGLLVSINSDDPAFFGSLYENYKLVHTTLHIDVAHIITCVRNSFLSAFMPQIAKQQYLEKLNAYVNDY